MKRNRLIVGVIIILLISSCAPQATPTANPLDVQHTAEAAAFTMVAQTQEAIPTNTPVPPTETASPTALPTLTSPATITADPALPTMTGLPTIAATSAPQQSSQSSASTADACNKPLTTWDGPTANFTVINQTKPKGEIVLSLYVESPRGDCGYLTDLSAGPVGTYSAGAFVDGEKDFKVFGGFYVQEGNWKILVSNDNISATGSCNPNC